MGVLAGSFALYHVQHVVHSYIMNAESCFKKKFGHELNKFNRRLFFNER